MRDRKEKRKQKRDGFTLAEMLLTIGIMVILAGISFVALGQYQRKLKLLEMDGSAQELFMAAQNQMSTLEANGTLELLSGEELGLSLSVSQADAIDMTDSHQYYALIHNAGEDTVGTALLSYLLPFGTIDDTVRTDGNYRIEYDYTAKTVTAVYYSHTASFLGSSGDAYCFAVDGSDSAALQKAAGDKKLRQHFDGSGTEVAGGAIVGYYGGGSKTVPNGTLTAPVLSIENGARLLLHIRMSEETAKAETTLYVRGMTSGKEASVALGELSNVVSNTLTKTAFRGNDGAADSFYTAGVSKSAGEDREYLLSLDSVTESGAHFAELFPTLMPGEDIELYVKTCSSAMEAKSNTVSANSLFASVETEMVPTAWTFDDNGMGSLQENHSVSVPAAMIANVRHLENLDPTISGLSTDTGAENCIQIAVQTGDLVYAMTSPVVDDAGNPVALSENISTVDAFAENIAEYAGSDIRIYDLNGNSGQGYRPIQNDALLSYDGKGNRLVNFDSATAVKLQNEDSKGQGIFAGISGQKDAKMVSVRDIQLLNCRFTNAEGAAAGALVGVVGNSHQLVLQGIETENCQLSSSGNVGGLIGTAEAGGSDSASVKLYVNECGILGEYGSVDGGNAGGLAGKLNGSADTHISNSTASAYVRGSSNAGGLLGEICGRMDIRFSYVGGHTKDGTYPADDADAEALQGRGRWNVQSQGNAGGFVGLASSVNLDLLGCYTMASVQSTGNAGAFLAAVSGSGAESASYCYAAGKVSGSNVLSEDVKNLVAEGSEYKGASYARPYDTALKTNNGNPQYPYKTAVELFTAAAEDTATGVTGSKKSLKYCNKHIGDFCPTEETVDTFVRFLNGPRLYAEVFTPLRENETNYLTMVLTGTAENDAAKTTLNLFQFSAVVQSDGKVALTRIDSPNSSEKHIQYNKAGVVSVTDRKYLVYRILLDDISAPYMHFSDNTKGIRVGSNVTAYAIAEQRKDTWYTEETYQKATIDPQLADTLIQSFNTDLNLMTSNQKLEQYTWTESSASVFDTDNSLFGKDSTPLTDGHTAYILSCRHLENLDHYVSRLENEKGKRDSEVSLPEDTNVFSFRKAVQEKDLDWDQYIAAVGYAKKEAFKLYKPKSEDEIMSGGYFYGIQNLLLTEYNGNYHSISNLRIQGDKNDYNTAGLFAAVPSLQQTGLSIRNLKLYNVDAYATKSNGRKNSVAALVGYYGSSQGLGIQNVVIEGAEIQSDMDAGGLIGLADGSGTLNITNCAVYEGSNRLLISSVGGQYGRNKTTEGSASAGGLIGRVPSGKSLTIALSGCSVYGKNTLILAKGSGKTDECTDDSAGGLVGTILSGTLNIDNCGVTAYVYAPNGDCTGGLVGDFSASGSIQNSYVGGLTTTENGKVTFKEAVALDYDAQEVVTPGGYNIYGHLATGGLVGYSSRAVQIDNCFMTASVSENGTNCSYYNSITKTTPMCYLGGLIGQIGGGSGGHIRNCYVAGKLWDNAQYNTLQGGYYWFTGSIIGYSESGVDGYAANVYCLKEYGYTKQPKCYVGGVDYNILYSNNNLNGCSAVSEEQLQDRNQTAARTESFDSSLADVYYPLMTWTRLYTPTEILGGSNDLNAAPLRFIGDWCF